MRNPKIVFLDAATVDFGDVDWSSLKKQGEVKCHGASSNEEIVTRSFGAQVIITNKYFLNEAVLRRLPDLKLICVAATGVNNIDLEAAQKQGVAVANVAGYSTQTVVEHTFLFLLAFSHRLLEHHQAAIKKVWSRSSSFALFDFPYSDLAGKTLGIVGYGTIGKKVASLAKSFGMKILIAALPERKYSKSEKRLPLKQVLKESDFVTLHCALSEETRYLINTKELALMKKTSCLLNLARGAVVNEWAVAESLQAGRLGGYAADVMEHEPPAENHPFFQEALSSKLILTPHIAWASRESRQRLVDEIAENIAAFKKGKERNGVV